MKKTLKIILSFIFNFIIINLTNGVVYSLEFYKTQSLRSFLIANVKILEQNINFETRSQLEENRIDLPLNNSSVGQVFCQEHAAFGGAHFCIM